jgi:hypothetical protein
VIQTLTIVGHKWISAGPSGWLIGDGTTYGQGQGIRILARNNQVIYNTTIQDDALSNYGQGIVGCGVGMCAYLRIIDNQISWMGVGMYIESVNDSLCEGNTFQYTYDDSIDYNSKASGNTITGNSINQYGHQGAGIKMDDSKHLFSYVNTMSSNTILNTQRGIAIWSDYPYGWIPNLTISSDTILSLQGTQWLGVSLENMTPTGNINNVVISDCNIIATTSIYLSYSNGATVTGSSLYEGSGPDSQARGQQERSLRRE